MPFQSQATREDGSLPPPGPLRSRSLLSRMQFRYSPEVLLIPVVFASKLGKAIPSTTLMELLRQTVCRLSTTLRGDAVFAVTSGSAPTTGVCDTPVVMRDFATVTAISSAVGGITALLGCGVFSRVSPNYGRKPVFLFWLVMELMWCFLILGSQFMPDGIADWVLLMGVLCNSFAEHLPHGYLVNMYIVDICLPERRTEMMSKIGGWGVFGVVVPLALGGSITTWTGNPMIVFYIATAIFMATFTYVVTVLPETLSKDKGNISCTDQDSCIPQTSRLTSILSIFEPLKMLIPFGTLHATRNWQLIWSAAHIFMFTVAHGYVWSAWYVIVTSKYHLTPADTGIYWACVTLVGTITMTVLVPQLIHFLRPYYSRQIAYYPLGDEERDNDEQGAASSNHLDVHITIGGVVFSAIFTLAAAASSTMPALIVCAVFVGFSFVHGSTMRSIVAGCVDSLKQGEALAAFEMVDSVGRILSPIVMGGIFTATVDSAPLFVFFVQMVLLFGSAGILWFVRDADGYHKLSAT